MDLQKSSAYNDHLDSPATSALPKIKDGTDVIFIIQFEMQTKLHSIVTCEKLVKNFIPDAV